MPKKGKYETVRCQFFEWRLVERKENGVWYADARTTSRNRGRHSLGTRDKQEALEQLVKLDRLTAEEQGIVPRASGSGEVRPLTIADGRKLYEAHNARPHLAGGTKKSTQKKYRSMLDKFEEFLATKRIADWHDVTKNTLTDYATHLADNGYAPKTIHGEITTLKTAFKWLSTEGHISRKPIELKLRKADCQRAYCYSRAEVAAMLAHCRASEELTWLLHVITALALTGMRISELAALKWSDIDFDLRSLTIADESGHANRGEGSRTTKNSRSRHVSIHSELVEVLSSIPKQDEYVFHGPRGGRLKPDTVRICLVRDVIEKLQERFPRRYPGEKSFEDGRLHSFRHYFCSQCANRGTPERVVMDWIGHADSEMVRHYYHLSREESRRIMDQLDLLGTGDGCSVTGEEHSS